MMSQKSLIIGMVLAVSMILLTASAWAAGIDLATISKDERGGFILGPFAPCDRLNLTGSWDFRVARSDESGNCWGRGILTISPGGKIQRVGTYTDCHGNETKIKGGRLTVYAGCVIEGTIDTSGGTLYVTGGAIIENKLVLATQN